ILAPAGLAEAATSERDRVFHPVSVGHVVDPVTGAVQVISRWGLSAGLAPAGATLTMSARDLARVAAVLLQNGVAANGTRGVSEQSIALMKAPQIPVPIRSVGTGWCIGPCLEDWDGVPVWGHPGGNISGGSYVYSLPTKNGAMAWTINTVGRRPRFEKMMAQD